ncbi:MAG TPA: ABC transporter substrate-binding protein [bacterium]|nr:ABC transporter substrate-binding protein [bacterium]
MQPRDRLFVSVFLALTLLAMPALVSGAPGGSAPTFTYARTGETETLDPEKTTAVASAEADFLIYDTLVSLDTDYTYKPSLAEKWVISPDGKTYTFTLRSGVRWQSGKPFTSADVKYTLDRWRTLKGSPSSFAISAIDTVDAPNPQTVVLHLKTPLSVLLDGLAGPFSSILNPDAVQKADADYGTGVGKVDGTGPFILREWVRNDRMVLARNPDYRWGPPVFKNQGPAHLGTVILKVITQDAPRLAAVQVGEAQYTPSVPPQEVDRLAKEGTLQLIRYQDLNTEFIGFKLGHKPLDDLKVRQAINYGINKREIIAGAYYGLGEPADEVLGRSTPGYWSGVEKIAYDYDPSRAKRILDEDGWKQPSPGAIRVKDGKPLSLLFLWTPGPEANSIVPLVQAELRGLGIEVRPRSLELTAFFAALRAGEHDIFLIGVQYTTADVLYFYFKSTQRPAPNRFDWADPETDKYLDISRTSTSETERMAAYQKVQEIIVNNALWVPLVHAKRVVAASKNLVVPKIYNANQLYKMLDLELK